MRKDSEAALEARDSRVHTAIAEEIEGTDARIEQLEDQLREAKAHRQRIRGAVADGHWWRLNAIISEDDIESLNEIDDGGRIAEWLANGVGSR